MDNKQQVRSNDLEQEIDNGLAKTRGNFVGYVPRYSGPNRSGYCVCGCKWDRHHLGLVMRMEYAEQTKEGYIPQECETFGFNEGGGRKLDADGVWQDHCHTYRDTLDDTL